ncbi:UbiA family prenyltransferase [Sphingomonas quercus]|uniref:UbiA family prenyltransferase n=1 Tax=Sphingomonas quercus TaxID=2842451 RepID=A0ABS6BFV4_9SPHN|nr:UbiA family prenyltransferase [Sphingomonas quercus]MBU3077175.1 UbiA family prenyltransferase [Sphingomonas quercus]
MSRVEAITGPDPIPLAVDVDGTLLRTDLLHEAALHFIARNPLQAPQLLVWLIGGKARLKANLADRIEPGTDSVPLREETLALIRAAQAEGRPVWLASASDRRYVEALADRIGGIAGVIATDRDTNVAGAAKAQRLTEAFGERGYDYVGDMPVDMAVWQSARRRLLVAHSRGFEARVRRAFPDVELVARPRSRPRGYIRAMRPHQWAKNALLFLPMIAGHHFDAATILATLIAFVCFCLAASSAYILNDLLDLPGDRDHPRKCRRPFAAGEVPIVHGILLGVMLIAAAIALAQLLPVRFLGTLLVYVVATVAYSMILKRKVVVDVIVLGGLYTLRVLGGLAATGTQQSPWLLMFSLCIFLSLALVKRCSELVQRRDAGKTATTGRGYRVGDLNVLFPLAAAAGYGAVLVVTLYMSSPEVMALYAHPARMWLVCPLLLYWISRVLILSSRSELHDDPVIFAITDRASWATGLCVGAIIAVSI